MPKRFCGCMGCPACTSPDRKPGSHGILFDLDTTGTLKCPACQAIATAKRNERPSSTSRGYDRAHERKRNELLAKFQPGDPCAECGKPMWSKNNLDLAHNADRSGWKGLAHARCNRATNRGHRRP